MIYVKLITTGVITLFISAFAMMLYSIIASVFLELVAPWILASVVLGLTLLTLCSIACIVYAYLFDESGENYV